MKKILFLSLHMGHGGIEKVIASLSNMLVGDYEIEIANSYTNKQAYYIDSKVKITYLSNDFPNKEEFKDALKSKNLIKIIQEGIKSISILKRRKKNMIDKIKTTDADIIISSRLLFNNLLGKYGKKNVIKIAHEHNHPSYYKDYVKNIEKSLKNIDYLIPVSLDSSNYFINNFKSKIKCYYIPNPLDNISDSVTDMSRKNLISVGRLSKEKGVDDLIDVFNMVHSKHPNYVLDIVGDGVELNNLKDKVKNLELEKSVNFYGFQDKEYINNLLSKSTIYISTSHTESFGISILEAMSFGVSCVIFDTARGALEFMVDNKNGYVIGNRDKEEMTYKIIDLIENKNKRVQFGQYAKKTSKKYSIENVKKQWLEFFKKIGVK